MTKRTWRVIAAAAWWVGAPAWGNLLVQPGFEIDPAGAAPVTGWSAAGTVVVEMDPDQAGGGTRALRMEQGFGGGPNVARTVQEVAVTAGEAYELMARIRNGSTVAVDPLTEGNSGRLRIEWLSGPGGGVVAVFEDEPGAAVYHQPPVGSPNPWRTVALVDRAPAGVSVARIVLQHEFTSSDEVEKGGSSWFDDVTFEVTTEVLPEEKPGNLLMNAGFETPGAGGGDVAAGWTESGDVARPLSGGFRQASLEMERPITGMALNISSATQEVAVTAGTDYVFTARVRNGALYSNPMQADNRAFLRIEWLDGSGGVLGTEEDPLDGQIDNLAVRRLWHSLNVAGTAPAGTATARVSLVHEADGFIAGGGTSWWDDVCFAEQTTLAGPIEIVSIRKSGTNVTLVWTTEAGATYTLEKTGATGVWGTVQSGVPDAGGSASATDGAATESAALYRVTRP